MSTTDANASISRTAKRRPDRSRRSPPSAASRAGRGRPASQASGNVAVPGVVQRQVALRVELQAPGAAVAERLDRRRGAGREVHGVRRGSGELVVVPEVDLVARSPASRNSGSRAPSAVGADVEPAVLAGGAPVAPSPPSARARTWPPRQQPRTGTSPCDALLRQQPFGARGTASASSCQACARPPSVISPTARPRRCRRARRRWRRHAGTAARAGRARARSSPAPASSWSFSTIRTGFMRREP